MHSIRIKCNHYFLFCFYDLLAIDLLIFLDLIYYLKTNSVITFTAISSFILDSHTSSHQNLSCIPRIEFPYDYSRMNRQDKTNIEHSLLFLLYSILIIIFLPISQMIQFFLFSPPLLHSIH